MPDDLLVGLRPLQNGHTGSALEVVKARFGRDRDPLSKDQWQKVNAAIRRWQTRLLAGAAHLPREAYHQGHRQTVRFLNLLGGAGPAVAPQPDRATNAWLQWLLEHELKGTLDRYTDEVREAVLWGEANSTNPTAVASRLYHATWDAERDWRMVARTEMARANALGRLDGARQMGYSEVWIPPHTGSCEACKDMIENRVFPAELLKASTNFGRQRRDWVPCLPLHPNCRHTAVPYIPELHAELLSEHERLREVGLTDEAIEEMYDSSGQLRPQYADDPRLKSLFGKTVEPYAALVELAVEKVRTSGRRVSKGFFDPPHAGLDPLVWEGQGLRPDVRHEILSFWTRVLGDGWQDWARVFITGSATSLQWGTGWAHPWLGATQSHILPDVDTHLVIDYEKARKARPIWRGMTPLEMRTLCEAWARKAKAEVEVAPGLRLDAYVRLETSAEEFERDAAQTGQGVYDVTADDWLIEPSAPRVGHYMHAGHVLAGVGGRLAYEHPDWVDRAVAVEERLSGLLRAFEASGSPEDEARLQAALDALYDARTAGFIEGAGQEDEGNWMWQYLENFGSLSAAKDAVGD